MKRVLLTAALGALATAQGAAHADYYTRGGMMRTKDSSPRVEKPRDDKPRNDQPRNDKPRDDRPREDKPRNDQPRDTKPRDDRPQDNTPRPPRPTDGGPFGGNPSRPRPGDGKNGNPVMPPGNPRPGGGYGGGGYNGGNDNHNNWPGRDNHGRDDHDNHDRDNHGRDRDKGRNYGRNDHYNYYSNRTVIVDRPVYVPYYNPPVYIDPGYNQPYYDDYDYSRYYYDRDYERQLDELEVIARQMKTAFRLDPVLGQYNLDTDTVGESIEVEGSVDTPAQLQRVIDVARSVDKDTRVVITRVRLR